MYPGIVVETDWTEKMKIKLTWDLRTL